MKIGIYMAYAPLVVLGKEGLGRYIGNLIKGFTETGHEVTIACPKWSLDTIDDLFQDFQVDSSKVNFLVSNRVSIFWRLYEKRYKKRYPKRNIKYKVFNSVADLLTLIASMLVSVTSFSGLLLASIVLLLLGCLMIPFVVIVTLLYLLVRCVWALLKKGKFSIKSWVNVVTRFIINYSSNRFDNLHTFLTEQRDSLVREDLVKLINRSANSEVWFIPSLFWPEVSKINKLQVICAPDLVPIEYPALFGEMPSFIPICKTCEKTICDGDYFITYCGFLKESLLVKKYGKKENRIVSIPHINNDMREHIAIHIDSARLNSHKDFSLAFSKNLVNFAVKNNCRSVDENYLKSIDVQGIKYLFYASQIRPHKNILSLVKAYEYLLRNRHINMKLIMTGTITAETPCQKVSNYIKEKRLQYDILFVSNVTAQELAALYKCATLVVNPTLYEGGFPFTFGEGMSVGTPSVMSDIPQVREVVERYHLENEMLFDPYDWKDMADCIERNLKDISGLYEKEYGMYSDMEKRTGSVVAAEYVKAFEYFIDLDRMKQNEKI